jgi:hypothetical protein
MKRPASILGNWYWFVSSSVTYDDIPTKLLMFANSARAVVINFSSESALGPTKNKAGGGESPVLRPLRFGNTRAAPCVNYASAFCLSSNSANAPRAHDGVRR